MFKEDKLLKKNCIIISEFSPTGYRKLNHDPKDYLEGILGFGYEIYDIASKKQITHNEFENFCELEGHTDLIFLKRNNPFNTVK